MQKQPSRKKAFLTQATGGYILTVIAIVKGLFLLPIYFKFISYDMYGYWITIGGIVALLSIINFGIGTMVTQRVSKAYAKKDFEAVGDYFVNSLVIYFFIAIIFLGIGFTLSYWLENMIDVSIEQLKLLKTAFYLALLTMVFSFFSDAFRGFAGALLKPLFGMYVMVVANLIGIVLVLVLLYSDFGLLSLPISLLVAEIIIVVLCGLYVLVLYKQFHIKSKNNTKVLKEYLSFSPHLLKLAVGNKLLENSHPILITSFLGAELTAAYDVTRKVIEIILRILHVLNASLLAPFSHLVGEGDITLIKQTTTKIVLFSFLIGLVGYGVYIATNGMFISLWIGKDIVLSQGVIILLGLSAFVFSMNRLFRNLLFGFDELKFATNSVIIEAIAYVGLSSIFIGTFGIITVPFVFLVVSSFFSLKLWNKIATLTNIIFSKKQIIKYSFMLGLILCFAVVTQIAVVNISWIMFFIKICITILGIVIIEGVFNYQYFTKLKNNKNNIYCIGDSHISFFSGNDKMIDVYPVFYDDVLKYIKNTIMYIYYTFRFKTFDRYSHLKAYRIGAVLAYSLNKQNTALNGREKVFRLLKKIPSGSKVLFSFGEIDCRAHIQKQAQKQQVEVSKVIDDTVKAYGEFLNEVQKLGYQIYVWNVIPNIGDFVSEEFPTKGTQEERMNIVNEFNNKVKSFCDNSDKKFITIVDELGEMKDKLSKKYYIDHIHLSQFAMNVLKLKYNQEFGFQLKKIEKYNENIEKIYVIGYPKSGNTWLARLISEATNSKIYVESKKDKINSSENIDDKNGKYLIHKVHATNNIDDVLKSKKIYILRDPRAAIVSGFFHSYRNISEKNIQSNKFINYIFSYEIGKLNKFWSASILNKIRYLHHDLYRFIFNKKNIYKVSWSSHVNYWSSVDGIVVVRYEDLLDNTFIEVKKILDELGIIYSDEELKKVIENQSFSKKKKEFFEKGDMENAKFLRSGEKESWRKLLDFKLQKKIETLHKDMMRKFGYKTETI